MAEETTAPKAKKEPTVYTSVEMTDGRTVQFAGKKKMLKDVLVGEDGSVRVRFDFLNGETRTFAVSGSPLFAQFAGHGASQKIGDAAAGESDVEDIIVAVDTLIEQLSKGEWGVTRAAGDSFAGASIVIRAICEVKGKSVEEVKKFLQGKLDEDKAKGGKLTRAALYNAFRAPNSKTGAVIARLEQEKLAKGQAVNSDDLLEELEA